jgi:phosphate transport system substrate-binding protein
MGMISRALKPEESELASHLVAMDGVCVIVHRDNPVVGLSRQQLVEIYTGKVTDWGEAGGAAGPITVANKAEGRATLEVFLAYTGLDSADVKADVVVGENQQAVKTVAGNPGAIGYVSVGTAAAEAAAGTPIKLVSCDDVAASTETVARGEFPITRPLLLVTKGEPSPEAKAFLDYMTSAQVRDIVEKHLYVPVAD